MNFEEAKESVRQHLNKCKTVVVLEDGTVYLNTDIEVVKGIAGGLKAYSIKPEIKEELEVKKPKKLKDE